MKKILAIITLLVITTFVFSYSYPMRFFDLLQQFSRDEVKVELITNQVYLSRVSNPVHVGFIKQVMADYILFASDEGVSIIKIDNIVEIYAVN